jgi:hypothetical protein
MAWLPAALRCALCRRTVPLSRWTALSIALSGALALTAQPAAAQAVLTCGQLVNESIAAALEQDHFTFFGEQGDVVTLTFVETGDIDAGFAPVGHRFTPGSTVPSVFGQGIQDWTLPETGTYTVRIFEVSNTRRGNYALRLAWLLPIDKRCGEQTPLTCGQLSAGSIATPLEADLYTFTGQQGDTVTFTFVEAGDIDSGFAPVGHRYTPGSSVPLVFGQGIQNWTLPESGTYTVRIFEVSNRRRGNYGVRLTWLLPLNRQCGDRSHLTCGQLANGSIATPLEQDLFTFSAQAGETVTWTFVETGDIDSGFAPVGHRFTPSGTAPLVFGQGIQSWTLPETGTYIVRIFEVSHRRRGNYSVRLGTVGACPLPQAPGVPTNLTVSVVDSTVTLNWSAPSTGGQATSYVLEAGRTPGSSNLAVFDTGNGSTSFTAAPVAPGTYFVRVKARNAAGTSAASNEVIAVVGALPTHPPGTPTNLSAAVVGSTVTLSWMAPLTGGAVTTYVLDVGVAPGDSSIGIFVTGSTATSLTAFSVPPGAYFVRVRARNASGTSAPSNEIVILVGGCSAPPAAPSPLTMTVNGNAVTLQWTAPSGVVTTYLVEVGSIAGGTDLANFVTGNANTSLMAIATPGTYFVRVRARNTCGTSGPSNEVVVTVF